MKKTFEYLLNISKEIEEQTDFRYAAEEWAVIQKISEGSLAYIKLLNEELDAYLYGDMKKKRVELTDEQIQQIETARQEANKKAKRVFGTIERNPEVVK